MSDHGLIRIDCEKSEARTYSTNFDYHLHDYAHGESRSATLAKNLETPIVNAETPICKKDSRGRKLHTHFGALAINEIPPTRGIDNDFTAAGELLTEYCVNCVVQICLAKRTAQRAIENQPD